MTITPREIYRRFGGKLFGTRTMKKYVCRTLAKFPPDVIDHITSDCWFLGSTTDAWAYTFRGDEVADKHLIILADSLWDQLEEDIIYTIAHEIGHVALGHRNAILEPQTKRETAIQEKEAREFALKYI
jgi:hypothetical protein